MTAWKRIGVVRSVNALKRELRVTVEPRYAAWIAGAQTLHIVIGADAPVPCRVQRVRTQSDTDAIVDVTPGVPRDTIGRMRRAKVVARDADLAGIDTTPTRASELIGYRVVDVDGQDLGEITDAYETAYNAAIQVESKNGSAFLLPLVDAVLERIDPETAVVTVRDIAAFAVDADGNHAD